MKKIVLIALVLLLICAGVTILGSFLFDDTPVFFLFGVAVPLGFIADRAIRKIT